LSPAGRTKARVGQMRPSYGVRRLLLMGERPCTKHPIVHSPGQMASNPEQIADHRVYRQESLSLAGLPGS